LLILPDVQLAGIPFDALDSQAGIKDSADFRDLNYFITRNEISYSYTASLWMYKRANALKLQRSKKLLAMAPSYDAMRMQAEGIWPKWSDQLRELTGIIEETNYLSKTFTGRVYQHDRAIESKFKEVAGEADYIHLAMHAIPDNADPLQSALFFHPVEDEGEDGRLTGAEILDTPLKAKLTVLSACNTGTGKTEIGEGIISLARSFIIAGSPSVVLTQWALDDLSGQQIIKSFYNNISGGIPIAKALQSAKITHVNQATKLKAHPYFWAGVILMGQDQVIDIKKKEPLALLIFAAFAIILLFTATYLLAKRRATIRK